jgi:hypothetical protein
MANSDDRWKQLPSRRRAAVYRAIGRASREARLDEDSELAADVRVALDVVRTHAQSKRAPRRKAGTQAQSKRTPRRKAARKRTSK